MVGGPYTGAPTYSYKRGPEGQLYAVGGKVSIDASPIPDDPEATINKMQTVRSAALAPAEPSPEDLRVAQEATRQLLQAQAELRSENGGEEEDSAGSDDARVGVFRDVDGFTDASSSEPPRLRATA